MPFAGGWRTAASGGALPASNDIEPGLTLLATASIDDPASAEPE